MWGAARRSLQLLDRSPCAIVLARRDTCRARLRLLHPRSGRPFAPGQFGAAPSRGCREGDQQAQLHQRGRPQKKPRQSAARLSDDVHRGWACRSSPRAFLPPRRRSANAPTGPFLPTPVMASGGLFALGLWPLDQVRHVRSLCTETAGSRGACGRARAVAWRASCAPRNDRSASSLAGRPCLIIGVRECRHGTGNIVRRASVEATSVVGDRARVRRFRRIRTVHISGRPAQTAAALPGVCVQAASHPRIGGKSVPPPVLSERA